MATAEGALDEVAALLKDIKAKILEAANEGAFSTEEIEANQLQIDSAIDSITRIANTTTFAGRKLLDGSLAYATSGVNLSQVMDLQVHAAQFGSRESIPVNLDVSVPAGTSRARLPVPSTDNRRQQRHHRGARHPRRHHYHIRQRGPVPPRSPTQS